MPAHDPNPLLDRIPIIKAWRKYRRLRAMRTALHALPMFHQHVLQNVRLNGLTISETAAKLSVDPQIVEDTLVEVILALVQANQR